MLNILKTSKTITQIFSYAFIVWGILLLISKDTTNGLLAIILGELLGASIRTYKINKIK